MEFHTIRFQLFNFRKPNFNTKQWDAIYIYKAVLAGILQYTWMEM